MKSGRNSKKVESGNELITTDGILPERIGTSKLGSGNKASKLKLEESRRKRKSRDLRTPGKIVIGLFFCFVLALASGPPATLGATQGSVGPGSAPQVSNLSSAIVNPSPVTFGGV